MATYILFVYTNWVSDLETRYQVGWVSISMLIANVAINLAFLVGVTASEVYTKLKMYWLRYKARMQRKKRKIEYQPEEEDKNGSVNGPKTTEHPQLVLQDISISDYSF